MAEISGAQLVARSLKHRCVEQMSGIVREGLSDLVADQVL